MYTHLLRGDIDADISPVIDVHTAFVCLITVNTAAFTIFPAYAAITIDLF